MPKVIIYKVYDRKVWLYTYVTDKPKNEAVENLINKFSHLRQFSITADRRKVFEKAEKRAPVYNRNIVYVDDLTDTEFKKMTEISDFFKVNINTVKYHMRKHRKYKSVKRILK